MITDAGLTAALTQALRSFAAVEREIVRLGALGDASKAHQFLQLRRQLVDAFAHARMALEAEPRLIESPTLMSEAMRQLAAFRTANAINQADWPVIRVRDEPQQYKIASQSVARASQDFWNWVDRGLGFRP